MFTFNAKRARKLELKINRQQIKEEVKPIFYQIQNAIRGLSEELDVSELSEGAIKVLKENGYKVEKYNVFNPTFQKIGYYRITWKL